MSLSRSRLLLLSVVLAIVAVVLVVLLRSCDERPPASGPSGSAKREVPMDAGKPAPPVFPSPAQACDLTPRPRDDSCPIEGCGSNAAYVSGFVIDGLNLDGCRNHDGALLVRGSVRKGASSCPDVAMNLDVLDGALIGRATDGGAIVCSATDVSGLTFTVEGPSWALGLEPTLTIATRTLRIRATDTVEAWNPIGPREVVRSYTFEPTEPGAAPVCVPASGWLQPWASVAADAGTGAAEPTPAVLVFGELYHRKEAVVLAAPTDRPFQRERWLNVACAGGALSKMRLMGLDPLRSPAAVDERQATLKMITAKYCGDLSFTSNGMPLLWESLNGRTATFAVRPPEVGPVEACWTSTGATCLSHGRAWRAGAPTVHQYGAYILATEAALLETVHGVCNIPHCPADGTCPTSGGRTVYWKTSTAFHAHP